MNSVFLKTVTGLLAAYGFSVQAEDREQRKIRFASRKTFMDIWDGKKGITIGVYNPATGRMRYERRVGEERIEEIVSKIK